MAGGGVGRAGAGAVSAGIRGAAVGVRQHTAHTRTPLSFTNVQCSHSQDDVGAGGGGPNEATFSAACASFLDLSCSLSLSESASLEGIEGDGVRGLVRRDIRDLALGAGEAARDPVRDAALLSAGRFISLHFIHHHHGLYTSPYWAQVSAWIAVIQAELGNTHACVRCGQSWLADR